MAENLTAPGLGQVTRLGLLRRGADRALAGRIAADVTLDKAKLDALAGTLSGGHQQKVALGKWLAIAPRVLLVEEPTRSVDVGARAKIYIHLRRLADQGMAILFCSSDNQKGGRDAVGQS